MDAKIVAIANQKGGVGKTSTTMGLASTLARGGAKTLVIDMDPQANSTRVLQVDTDELPTMADLMLSDEPDVHIGLVIVSTTWGVDLAPSSDTLARADWGAQKFRKLRSVMHEGLDGYDVVLIDCPPNLGHLVTNALAAATHVVGVTDPSIDGLSGLVNMAKAVSTIRRHMNPRLDMAGLNGVVVNKMDRTVVARSRLAEIQGHFEDRVWAVIPSRASWREALELSVPLGDPSVGKRADDVAAAFTQLAAHVLDA